MRFYTLICAILAAFGAGTMTASAESFTLVEKGKAATNVYVVPGERTPAQQKAMSESRDWLTSALAEASGATLLSVEKLTARPTIVLTTVNEDQPKGANLEQLRSHHDAYAVITKPKRLWLIGNNAYAVRHAVAHLLNSLGFRYYAPSEQWHVIPKLNTVSTNLNVTEQPDLGTRSIWYAYGNPIEGLTEKYRRWSMGNRLSLHRTTTTGHAYGHIINRNKEAFGKHPEYFALQEDGSRDSIKSPNAAKFCFSNPGLIELAAKDRIVLLEQMRKNDPTAYMVSMDPSDGQGTCHCDNCIALGTTSDRVFHLANGVAKQLRDKYPNAWVGLYAYSSHRLPPTIELEPNIYVQVAMGFNRTQYSLPELVDLWSKKVGAVGLREYYGVQAWDWGLPGRLRGARVSYHRKWIPFYAKRKLNAINAETNSNWGAQSLGLYIASELMWDVNADVDALMERYFQELFGSAAEPMKTLQAKFDLGPPLQPATLSPMFDDLSKAYDLASTDDVRARLVDMMAYLVYVDMYRRFETVSATQGTRNDVYYEALKPLMTYAWQIRGRDVVHYYALARRLCNGLPIKDKRMDFYMANKEQAPVWQTGDPLTDEQITAMFRNTAIKLKQDASAYVTYSRYFEPVNPPGKDAGPSKLFNGTQEHVIGLRGPITGYLIPGKACQLKISIKPTGRSATLTVYRRGDDVLVEKTTTDKDKFTEIVIDIPRANEYRWVLDGHALLHAGPEVPLVYESSVFKPAWVDYSGPSYFYVPKSTKQILVSANPRLSLWVPGQKKRLDVVPASRAPGKDYVVIDVPKGAAGTVWHTDSQTRGKVILLNIPPFFSLNRNTIYVPREVAESDELTTAAH